MKHILILFILSFTNPVISQSNLYVGEKAPEIHITDWIQNQPKDKSLSGKFIVLEFWASWCGPCLQAVPHLNELQDSFHRDDVYFISITDESPEIAHNVLKRIPFHSIVVSDQSEQTHIAFGDGEKGLKAIPMTVLIDDQNIIQWVGRPRLLTSDIMQQFLDGSLKGTNNLRGNTSSDFIKTKLTENTDSTSRSSSPKTFQQIIADEGLFYRFDIRRSNLDTAFKSYDRMGASFQYKNHTLKELVTSLSSWKEGQVIISDSLASIRYTVLYKNTGIVRNESIVPTMLNALQLQADTIIEETVVYEISVKDETKLDPTAQKLFSSSSNTLDKLIIKNVKVSDLVDALNEFSPYLMETRGSIPGNYDFIIEINSFSDMLKSLESYGLRAQKVEKEVEKLVLDIKNN